MTKPNKNTQKTKFKRLLIILSSLTAFLAFFYYSGLYTEFRGAMQHALLWTGLYDAKITTIEGPVISENDYNIPLSKPNGEQVKFKKFKDKVLFVNIWASWCLPCRAEMPTIETLHKNVSDSENIKFLLISVDKERERAIQFMREKDFSMPYYFPDASLPRPLNNSSIPATYVISKEGQIVYQKKGMADYSSDSFRKWILKLAES